MMAGGCWGNEAMGFSWVRTLYVVCCSLSETVSAAARVRDCSASLRRMRRGADSRVSAAGSGVGERISGMSVRRAIACLAMRMVFLRRP